VWRCERWACGCGDGVNDHARIVNGARGGSLASLRDFFPGFVVDEATKPELVVDEATRPELVVDEATKPDCLARIWHESY